MDNKILEFLKNHRVGSLTTLLSDGLPHSAAMHYSHQDNPVKLFFSTENTSRKCQGLIGAKTTKASFVAGFSEEEWLTFQIEGEIRIITDPEELKTVKAIHYTKHPNSKQYENNPATIFLELTPKWWRYTDHNTKPETILSS